MRNRTKKITTVAMLAAFAYVVMAVGRLPITSVAFLKYDPKDVVIVIAGFIFGPLTSFLISLVVSLLEMFTLSETGVIGLVMNVLSTCGFACTAAFIYKRKRSFAGALTGLLAGCLVMTALMLLWNFLITPLYMGQPRSDVVRLLLPVFLPFNLVKGGLNAGAALLLYKPVVTALRKSHLIEPEADAENRKNKNAGAILIGGLLLASGILIVLVMRGIL